MRTREKTPARLREMNPTRALAYCANITSAYWSRLESDTVLDLWRVFRAYILNGYRDTGVEVPAGVVDIWHDCKPIIDEKARL